MKKFALLIALLIPFLNGCNSTPRKIPVYEGKVVAKNTFPKTLYKNTFLGPVELKEKGTAFGIQIARDEDGWKRWFEVSFEEYENYQVGDHLKFKY